MIFASVTQFHVHLLWVNDHLSIVSVLNEKVLVGAFNKEKALVGAFSVILKLQTSRRFVSSSTGHLTLDV